MKRLLLSFVLVTALLMGCKESQIPQSPPSTSSPSVPSPKFDISFTILDPSETPDTADSFVAMAAEYSNSVIEVLNNISDTMRFDFSNPPKPSISTFDVNSRVVITWDSAGITYKLVIVTKPGIVRETLYVNGESKIGITFDNFILVDVSIDYQVVDGDTFGSGIFNFYVVKDTQDTYWKNSDTLLNLFWEFYVQRDTADYLIAVDTLYTRRGSHDYDLRILNVFGAKHPEDYVHVGYAFSNLRLYHIKNYYADTRFDELDYVYNPKSGPVKVSMPHNPYEVIPKMRELRNMIRNVKITSIYEGWYYGLRFEINPLYEQSGDTARIYWDEPDDGEQLSDIPRYPIGPFDVPPFDVSIEW